MNQDLQNGRGTGVVFCDWKWDGKQTKENSIPGDDQE